MRKSPLKLLVMALAALSLSVALAPCLALAEEADIAAGSAAFEAQDVDVASGTWGTCSWTIDANGVLTVGAGVGAGTNSASPWEAYSSKVTEVKFTPGGGKVVLPERSSCLFKGLTHVSAMSLANADTSAVTDMYGMFYNCSSLSSLDVSGWDTSKVSNMGDMFEGCSSLASLDLSDWDTSNATSMGFMFYGCSSLASLDASGWDTSKVADMSSMFYGCWSLASLDASRWDTSAVKRMFYMFYNCSSLASLDASGWNTSAATDMSYMFYNCSSLSSLDLSGWDTSKVTDASFMFSGCSSLDSLDLSSWDTSAVTDMSDMFRGCSSLASLGVSGWDTSSVLGMGSMFRGCQSLSSLDLSSWDTSAVADVDLMFYGCSTLASLNFGPAFSFVDTVAFLPDVAETDVYTGKWERASDKAVATSAELMARSDLEGTWTWQKKSQDDPTPTPDTPTTPDPDPTTTPDTPTTPDPTPTPAPTPDPDPTTTPDPDPTPTPEKPDLKQYEGTAASSGMNDLKAGEWFMDPATGAFPGTSTLYIDYTIARGLMGGYKDEAGNVVAFGPHDSLSRAQTATILYRLAKPDSKATTEPAAYEDNASGLTDVASRQYYTAAVNWCVKEGIITGYKNAQGKYTTCGPDDSVSREQLATMIFRYCTKYAERDADTADIKSFSDYAKISEWARDGVAYCVANKIVGGYTDGSGRFGPQDSAERCQMSKIIAVTAYMLE